MGTEIKKPGSIITLTTDFGEGSPYVAAMKGVILSIFPETRIVDLSHRVPPQDIPHAAAVLQDVAPLFPPGTLHVVVVDPGVGTAREILYAEIGDQRYLFPDNGVLGALAETEELTAIFKVQNPEFWRAPVSNTFHGRDIFAPVAAHLAAGLAPERLGERAAEITRLPSAAPRVEGNRIHGIVRSIDTFGNLITNIHHRLFDGRATDSTVCVIVDIYETYGLYRAYADLPEGALIALVGSNGCMELAVVGDSAAKRLGVEAGQAVTVAWE